MYHNPMTTQRWNDYERTSKYRGKRVRTTRGNEGVVVTATLKYSIVVMEVRKDDGTYFITDNEHATIVRNRDAEA